MCGFKKQTIQNNPVRSGGLTLQGKRGKTVVQIQFVCVTSSFCGWLWGVAWGRPEKERIHTQRDTHYFSLHKK